VDVVLPLRAVNAIPSHAALVNPAESVLSAFVQLDLFGERPNFVAPSESAPLPRLIPERLSDEELIAAIPDASLADACALAAEVGRRRVSAAVPALAALCNRFVGYGADVKVPEQAVALEALGEIGGPEASRVVVRAIVRGIVQGPTLVVAVAVASRLGVKFPTDTALALLRHPDPSVRAPACSCVRAAHEIIATLIAMFGDRDGDVAIAAACALGRMGRAEARGPLKRCLIERPSPRVIEALAGVADDEAIVFLARVGRARRELASSIVSALAEIDNARASAAASGLKKFLGMG
jgi:HEAT repeat protein